MNGLIVTDFPVNSIGDYFIFKVSVITKYATLGVDSNNSAPLLLAGVPD